MDKTIAAGVTRALALNEIEAEKLANRVRLLFLSAVGVLALLNALTVTPDPTGIVSALWASLSFMGARCMST